MFPFFKMYLSIILTVLFLSFNISLSEEQSLGKRLFIKYSCGSCHDIDRRVVGPSLIEIAKRYGKSEKAIERVAELIINPEPSNWPGFAYMPPFKIPKEEARALARYVLIEAPEEAKKKKKEKQYEELDLELQMH